MNFKSKKLGKYLLSIGSVATLLSLAGCGGSSTSSGSGVQKIVVWYPDDAQKPLMDKFVKDFEKTHPNIQVEADLQSFTNYFQKIQTAVAAQSGPDIFRMNMPNLRLYVNKGFIKPLDVNLDWSNYPKLLVDSYTVNGKHYGVPKDFDTAGLFYNKALFDAAHVPYPTANWTWDDLRNAAKKLTVSGKQWGFNPSIAPQTLNYDIMLEFGSKLLSPDQKTTSIGSPEAIKATKFLYDMMSKDHSAPSGQWQIDNDPIQTFESGKVAMLTEGDWEASQLYKVMGSKLGVAPMPSGVQKGNIIHGTAWVVNNYTKSSKAAMEFASYLGSKDVAEAETQEVLPAYNNTQQKWIDAMPGLDTKVFVDAVQYATPYPSTDNPNWENPLNSELTNIWLGKESVANGLQKAQSQANDILAGK